ncbi:MAG: hypothetical protein AAF841_13525, partial [Pseudomonadota bacterium]
RRRKRALLRDSQKSRHLGGLWQRREGAGRCVAWRGTGLRGLSQFYLRLTHMPPLFAKLRYQWRKAAKDW